MMETWDKIVEDHGPGIYRLARRILGSGVDAEDVVQEAFLEVFRFQQKSKVNHWGGLLRRVVTHRAVDLLRETARRRAAWRRRNRSRAAPAPVQAAVASELAVPVFVRRRCEVAQASGGGLLSAILRRPFL